MPASRPEPEILRPRVRFGSDVFSDRNLDLLSHLLDDFLRIPGTKIRFGFDGVIGLIPGVGDVLGAMASWIIILAAWLRGVPRVTLTRMLANVAIETIVGTVPVLGDAFDIAWKANRKNFALLERSIGAIPSYGQVRVGSSEGTDDRPRAPRGATPQQRKKHAAADWLFLFWLFTGMLLILAIPLALLAYLAGKFFAIGAHHA